MAREMAQRIGEEVMLSRVGLGLSNRAAARLAGVAPHTQEKVEAGDPTVQIDTACRVAAGVGLRTWGRTFPASEPSLRDTGQLETADWLKSIAHNSYASAVELALGNLRSADLVLLGPTEIIDVEIERLLEDFQLQTRIQREKREALAAMHQRPVRLVLAIADTDRNRRVVRPHGALIRAEFPAGTREVTAAIRSGKPLGRDGILWVRRRRADR
jgi:DNA-binding XRE family transcriptional regulator